MTMKTGDENDGAMKTDGGATPPPKKKNTLQNTQKK
jgi:hypothetical protein